MTDSEEEEEDYMSDKFLEKCVSSKADVCPGLIFSQSEKRKHESLKRKEREDEEYRKRMKPARVVEEEKRQEGLSKEIGKDNKGFQLLAKMGYKPGSSLGKEEAEGMKEPIKVEVKKDRKGVGHLSMEKEQLEKARKRKQETEINTKQFRERAGIEAALRQVERDLRTAQKACRNLDMGNGKESSDEVWYWPKLEKPKKLDSDGEVLSNTVVEIDEDEEEDLPEVSEMLASLTEYLRRQYHYCIWCGTAYDNDEDLASSCPGNSHEDH